MALVERWNAVNGLAGARAIIVRTLMLLALVSIASGVRGQGRTGGCAGLTAPEREHCLATQPLPSWRCVTHLAADPAETESWIDFFLTWKRGQSEATLVSLQVLANEAIDQPWSDHHGLLAELEIPVPVATSALPFALAGALALGRSAIGPVRAFDTAAMSSRLAAEVDEATLASLVDRPRRLGRDVARNAARRRELTEEAPHARGVRRDVRIDLGIRPFQVDVRDNRGATVSRSGQVDDVGISVLDQAVQVHIDKTEARRGSPVSQQPGLDVFRPQRLAQQCILLQIDLANRQVIGRTPVAVQVLQAVRFEVCHHVLLRGR